MTTVITTGSPINLAASGIISKSAGSLVGFYVNSTTVGTIALFDGTTTKGTAISGTITPAIGYHGFPASCVGGCYATIGGTLNVTFFYQ